MLENSKRVVRITSNFTAEKFIEIEVRQYFKAFKTCSYWTLSKNAPVNSERLLNVSVYE